MSVSLLIDMCLSIIDDTVLKTDANKKNFQFLLCQYPARDRAFKVFDKKRQIKYLNEYKEWDSNGNLKLTCNYCRGKRNGEFKELCNNGQLYTHCFYRKGKLHGKFKHYIYDNKGQLCLSKDTQYNMNKEIISS